MIWNILLVMLLVAANGFFVAAEFALVKVRSSELEPAVGGASGSMRLANRMMLNLDVYLSSCQLGITLASLGLGWVGEPLVASMLEPLFELAGLPQDKVHYAAFPLAFFIITFLHLTVGEQAPKIGAIQRPRPTVLFSAYPLAIFYRVFRPFIALINLSSNGMLRMVGLQPVSEHDAAVTEEEVRVILTESAAMGHLGAAERRMLENVLDLEEKVARQYMVPRGEVVFLDRQGVLESQLEVASSSGHTRFPVCDGDLDHVVGIAHVKDLFRVLGAGDRLADLEAVIREPLIQPETVPLDVLLKTFQKSKKHMAILVDEYGSVAGIITLENVIEEMVGPIEDEFDAEIPTIVKLGEGRFEVDAACSLDKFVRRCGVESLPEGATADSVGGLVVEMLERIPAEGETVELGEWKLTVIRAQPTRIVRLAAEKEDAPVA